LVLCLYSIAFSARHSCGNNKAKRKNEFQVARFANTAVLHGCRTDNFTSHRQVDKQVPVVNLFDAVLFLFEDISFGRQ
jgi:hypothetical protein